MVLDKDISYCFGQTKMPDQNIVSVLFFDINRIANTDINKEGRIGYADVIGFVNFVLFRSRVVIFVFVILQ